MVIYEVLDQDGWRCLSWARGRGCPVLPRLPLKTYYLHWGGLGRGPFSNTCLDKTLRLGMKWKAVGPTVFYSAVVLRRKTQDVLPYCHGVNTETLAAGNVLAPEPCLPRPLRPCPQEKAAFLSPLQPGLGFRSHQPLWRLLWNRPFKMSSVRGDSQIPVAVVFSTYRPGNRGIRIHVHHWRPSSGRPRNPNTHHQHLSPRRWEDASPRSLEHSCLFLNLSLFGPNGLPPPWCAPPKIKLVFWGPAAAAKSLQ